MLPAIQLGVYEMSGDETTKAVGWALEVSCPDFRTLICILISDKDLSTDEYL